MSSPADDRPAPPAAEPSSLDAPPRDGWARPAGAGDPGDGDGIREATGPPTSRRRRRRWLAAGAVLVALIAVGAVVLSQSGSSTPAGTTTGVPAGQTTTTVSRRTLVESATVDGTLGYGASLELYDRLSGTFTWLPAVGAVVGRGGTLFRVNNQPVVLMYGSVPAYRTLKEGVSEGPDLTQLNDNLIDLGFDPYGAITDVSQFSEATAAAVRRWQHAEGLSETGEVPLGRVIFAPGARRVTDVHVVLGQDPAPAKAAEGPGSKAPKSGESAKQRAAKQKAAHEKAAEEKAAEEKAAKEAAAKKPSDGETGAKEPEGEGAAGAGMAVLTTTSTQQLVQLKVKAEEQTLGHVGQTAPITLPSGDVVKGRIIEVGSVASASSSESEKEKGASGEGAESATIPVTLALEHPIAHLDEAPVSVELVKAIRRDVLAVPATALTATAGGGYAIEVLEDLHREELAVTPGMFANGYVQVEGPRVREGLTVLESE